MCICSGFQNVYYNWIGLDGVGFDIGLFIPVYDILFIDA